MAYAAQLLGAQRAVAAQAARAGGDGERALRRAREHKRVSNGRMRKLLPGGALRYPSYREGLISIHEQAERDEPKHVNKGSKD